MQTPWKTIVLTIWMTVMPLLVSTALSYYAIAYESLTVDFTSFTWMLFFLLSSLTMGLALTPTTFVALLSGYFLGLEAIFYVVPAYTLASLLGYQLTRWIDEGSLLQAIEQYSPTKAIQLKQLLQGIQAHQFSLVVLARISPVLPFAMMNVVLPVAGVRLKNFLIAGTLGMLPRTLLSIWLGSRIKTLRTLVEGGGSGVASQIIFTVLLVSSLLGFLYYGRIILEKYVNKK